MLFGELRTELLIVRPRRVVDDVVPPDRRGQDFALDRRKIFHARECREAVFDMREVVIVAAGRGVGGGEVIASHRRGIGAKRRR